MRLKACLIAIVALVVAVSCGKDTDTSGDNGFGDWSGPNEPGNGNSGEDGRFDFEYFVVNDKSWYVINSTGEWVVELGYGVVDDILSRGFDLFGLKLRSSDSYIVSPDDGNVSFWTYDGTKSGSCTLWLVPSSKGASSVTLRCQPYVHDQETDRNIYFSEINVTVRRPVGSID